MTVFPTRTAPPAAHPAARPDPAILAAVEEDLRTTLRTAWLDPALRSITAYPVFFHAAWSATRPNVTRSFSSGSERIRRAALDALVRRLNPPDHSKLVEDMPTAERNALLLTVQAAHASAPKNLMVLQSWAALARRRRIPGTGHEEPPARRGVPEWQGPLRPLPLSVQDDADALLDEATILLDVASPPTVLWALARWPYYLAAAVRSLKSVAGGSAWTQALRTIRRAAVDGLRSLPHPMELQWDALSRRGLTEDRRRQLTDHLVALAGGMPVNLLASGYLAKALGVPELPGEG